MKKNQTSKEVYFLPYKLFLSFKVSKIYKITIKAIILNNAIKGEEVATGNAVQRIRVGYGTVEQAK